MIFLSILLYANKPLFNNLLSEYTDNHVFVLLDNEFWHIFLGLDLLLWDTWLGLDPSNYMPTSRKSDEYPQIRFLLEHGVKIVLNQLLFIKKFRVSRVTGTTFIFCFGLIWPFSFTSYLSLKFFRPIYIT